MKQLLFTLTILTFSLFAQDIAQAHPWNISYDWCHYCWTNCSKWWYTYWTRHCHWWWTPHFWPADPLYYSSYKSTSTTNKDSVCSKKYPWTIYRSWDDRCVCPWNEPYKWNKKTYCSENNDKSMSISNNTKQPYVSKLRQEYNKLKQINWKERAYFNAHWMNIDNMIYDLEKDVKEWLLTEKEAIDRLYWNDTITF